MENPRCPTCKKKNLESSSSQFGDCEGFFECEHQHIFAYHLKDDNGDGCNSKRPSTFVGWAKYDMDKDVSEPENGEVTVEYIKNLPQYTENYISEEMVDCSSFVWKCKKCKKEYVTMYCG